MLLLLFPNLPEINHFNDCADLQFIFCILQFTSWIVIVKFLGLKVKYVPSLYEPEKHSQSEKLRQAAHCFTYLCLSLLRPVTARTEMSCLILNLG